MISNESEILLTLENTFPDVVFKLSGDGCHFHIEAIGKIFAGQRKLQRQKMLNQALAPFIHDGRIHAVNYSILTPQEAENKEG